MRLHDSAVPSIFEAFPTYLQQKKNKRKPPTFHPVCDGALQEATAFTTGELFLTCRINQDHLKIYVSKIRSMGALDNKLSSQQFPATYETHSKILDVTRGKCMPL